MKNVFFALAFILVGAFAFTNAEVTSDIDIEKIKTLISVDNSHIQNFRISDIGIATIEYKSW